MMKRKSEIILDAAILALAVAFLFAFPQALTAAGTGDHGHEKADMRDPNTSETLEQEAEEAAQDVRQGTREAVRETEQAIDEAAREAEQVAEAAAHETAEMVEETERIIERATLSLEEVVEAERPYIPEEIIRNAAGVAIIPDVTKASFIAGARYGRGVLMLNQESAWNGPLFISLYGASVGAQLGVEQSDIFMVFNTPEAVNDLRDGDITFGAESSLAVGTLGEKAGATTDADILVYKRTEGLFAGISLSGAVLNVDVDANVAYSRGQKDKGNGHAPYRPDEVLTGQKEIPQSEETDKLIIVLKDWE